mmetsp:Transcript_68693/g.180121  ORF Transcript_68693/g.180121 Transcript_68693/m.180121 type:complete len:609 (-) Transcript_68693:35-1861(-)
MPLCPAPVSERLRARCKSAPISRAGSRLGPAEPWNGVSLGGWLLLEPGPASPLFERHATGRSAETVHCEWGLCALLRKRRCAEEVIRLHREQHVTKADFEAIRACGLNAVRLPFGYWVVLGPSEDEPYVGPALEFIDRAVDWAEECGLQIVLDLHGCPGGESGDAPSGRRQRPEGTWHWRQWRMKQSLEALEVVARRYSGRACVTGIEVCNEPSNTVPLRPLCRYYAQAVETIRAAGMTAGQAVVVLPIFQRPEAKVAKCWERMTGGKHERICFDVHCYHCFENEFHGKTLARQLRAVAENAKMLRKYPMVVGEWSLAQGHAAWNTCGSMSQEEVYRLMGAAQREAFRNASHGHFFWNWKERDCMDWNFQQAHQKGLFSGPPPQLPYWGGPRSGCEDPLEEQLHPSPPEPRVFFGDCTYLRVFHGGYLDVYGGSVAARVPEDKADKWHQITFCPPAARARASGQVTRWGARAGDKVISRIGIRRRHLKREAFHFKREVRHGDVVSLKAYNGRYLAVSQGSLKAVPSSARPSAKFVVHIETADILKGSGKELTLTHRGTFFLQCKASGKMLNADHKEDGVYAHWKDRGEWQRLAVEKETPAHPRPMQLS